MIALAIGLIVGFLMVIPIGPVNVSVVNTGLNRSYAAALSVGLGGAIMDMLYFFVIMSGLALFTFNDSLVLTAKIIGIIFIIIIGVLSFMSRPEDLKKNSDDTKIIRKRGYFLLGVFLYVSNPTIFAGLSALCAAIKSYNLFLDVTSNRVFLALGVGVGSAFWYWLLVFLVKKYREKFTARMLVNINKVCGVLVIIMAFYLGVDVFKEIFSKLS